MNDETFFHLEHLDELAAEKANALRGEPSANELAMLVTAMGVGDTAALLRDIEESNESLQRRFTIARKLLRAAKRHLWEKPIQELRKSQDQAIQKTLGSLPELDDHGHAVFSFKTLLKEIESPQGKKKGITILGSITTRTGLLAAIKRNFKMAEARRIIQCETITDRQFQVLMADPKRRKPRRTPGG